MRNKNISHLVGIGLVILLVLTGLSGLNLPAQAAAPFASTVDTPSIIAYWPLESIAGDMIQDTVGLHAGTCSGVQCPTLVNPGKVNKALAFDVADAVNLADGPDLSWKSSDSFSIELWVQMGGDCSSQRQVFVGKYRDSSGTYQSWWVGCEITNQAAFTLRDATGKSLTLNGGPLLNDGNWHQVVSVRDGVTNQNELYVDGALAVSQPQSYVGDFISSREVNLGYYNVAPFYHFVGSLDEVAIHNRVLTPAEITFHYNGGIGRPYTNNAPIAEDDGPIVAVKDTPVTFPAYFLLGNDADLEGDPLTITAVSPTSAQNGTITGSGPFTYTPPAGFTGSDSFQYTISDPKGSTDTATVSVTVRTNNTAPTLDPIGNQSNSEGATVSVPAHATDPEGDKLIYTATDLPDGLKINLYTGQISGTIAYTASTKSPYSVKVTAYDYGFLPSLTQSFTWMVSDVNAAPILSKPSNLFNTEGDSISAQIQAVDPDGGALTYTITGLPLGLYAIPSTGLIAGGISYQAFEGSASGSYTVHITVTDGTFTASDQFDWFITDATPPKTLLPFLFNNKNVP